MNIIKQFVKAIIRLLIRIRILFYRSNKYEADSNKALEDLKRLYPLKEYDLSDSVKKIDKYEYDLSLIVPVYNSEKYLKECIDSLLKQKSDYRYEIICIDDGSTDNSLNILNEYHDDRLKIFHQENGGISSARNKGLNLSKGEYIGFVDNDDYVSADYVDRLLDRANENDADYVRCSYSVFDDKREIEKKRYPDRILDNFDSIRDYRMWLDGYMWGGIYKRELFEDFCFPLGYWYEDMIRNIYLYDKCRVLSTMKDILYFKRKHSNNAADKLWNKEDLHSLDELYLPLELNRIKEERNINPGKLSRYALYLEMGEYLYKRTLNLEEDIRYKSFIAADLLFDADIVVNKRRDFELYYIRKAFLNKDYRLYNLIGKYCRYR